MFRICFLASTIFHPFPACYTFIISAISPKSACLRMRSPKSLSCSLLDLLSGFSSESSTWRSASGGESKQWLQARVRSEHKLLSKLFGGHWYCTVATCSIFVAHTHNFSNCNYKLWREKHSLCSNGRKLKSDLWVVFLQVVPVKHVALMSVIHKYSCIHTKW